MKKIIVATDFSAEASNATNFAVELAKVNESEILLLNTFYGPAIADDPSSRAYEIICREEKQYAEQKLRSLCKSIQKQNYAKSSNQIKCDFLCTLSDPVSEINELVKSSHFDWVVIGNTGDKDPRRFYESTAIELVKKLIIPVMIIPKLSSYIHIQNILYASELINDTDHSIKQVANFTNLFKAKLHLLNVGEPGSSNEEAVEALTQKILKEGVKKVATHTLQNDDPLKCLSETVKSEKIDLLVLLKHPHTFFEKIFHRSTIKKEIQLSAIPTLIIGA